MGERILQIVWEGAMETWGSKDRRWFPRMPWRDTGWSRLYQNNVDPGTLSQMKIATFLHGKTLKSSRYSNWNFERSLSYILGFYSRQMCCYYCRACAWTYVGDNPAAAEFLYTNFGPQAAHRNTFHILGFINCFGWKNQIQTNGGFPKVIKNIWISWDPFIHAYHHGICSKYGHSLKQHLGWYLWRNGSIFLHLHHCALSLGGHHGDTFL